MPSHLLGNTPETSWSAAWWPVDCCHRNRCSLWSGFVFLPEVLTSTILRGLKHAWSAGIGCARPDPPHSKGAGGSGPMTMGPLTLSYSTAADGALGWPECRRSTSLDVAPPSEYSVCSASKTLIRYHVPDRKNTRDWETRGGKGHGCICPRPCSPPMI